MVMVSSVFLGAASVPAPFSDRTTVGRFMSMKLTYFMPELRQMRIQRHFISLHVIATDKPCIGD